MYVKRTYPIAVPLSARNLLRLRETIFWEESEGLGATTRFDLERLFTDDLLARWTGSATFTQEIEGVRWFSQVTLFQSLRDGRALSYQAGITAESDSEVPITDYDLRVIYRRNIFNRGWLFLELRSSVAWPRESLLVACGGSGPEASRVDCLVGPPLPLFRRVVARRTSRP